MTSPRPSCPSCGTPASGSFCSTCGAALASKTCGACGAALAPGSRFCPACGVPVGRRGRPPASRQQTLWFAAAGGVALMLIVLAFLIGGRSAAPPPAQQESAAAVPADGSPPDISRMTPRERFDRLYNRVMRAAEAGDTGSVNQFGPMALRAYQQLDSVDADARYHAAMLRLHIGDAAGAAALADSIAAVQPSHLFGWLIRGMTARWTRDQPALAAAQREYVRVYHREMAAGRPEYEEHRTILERFLREAGGRAEATANP